MRLAGRIVFVVVVAALGMSSVAHAEKRVALMIGNGAYIKAPRLDNPKNDAAAMETMFKAAGFDAVVRVNDLGIAAMRRALRDFSDTAHDADVGVIFYAGHGIEVGGVNYLIPIDAVLERDIDVPDEAVSLDRINLVLERVKYLRLVILDACRDNPFARSMRRTIATRTVRSGYGEIDERSLPPNTLIAYAQRAGFTAEDGVGSSNSPYTTALIKHLPTPGLDVELALRRVRDEVLRATNNRQEPFKYGSLGGAEIVLVAAKNIETTKQVELPSTRRLSEAVEAGDRDESAWGKASGANRLTDYQAYLAAWPEGVHASDARSRVDRLNFLRSRWETLASSRNLPELEDFLHIAADTEFGPPAQIRLAELSRSELEAWEVADKLQTVVAYRRFSASWPDGYYKDAAAARIGTLEKIAGQWEVLKSSDNEAALEAFITEHGWSEPGAQAVARLVALRREREHPSRDNIVVLTATELLAAMDGKDVEFVGSGMVIRFDSRSVPPFRKALGRDFLKSVVKEDVVIMEGAFRATPGSDGHASYIEGLGAVVQSRVDNTGSLFLIQMHGSERRRQDVDQKDRLHSAISIIRSPHGYVCVRSQWGLMLAAEAPLKLSESCRFAAK
jgi:Caspase domain